MEEKSIKRVLFLAAVGLGGFVFLSTLDQVFSGNWILSQAFHVGPIVIHYYGITMALGVGAGYWLAVRRAKQYGITEKQADSLLLWLVIGGFVGARLYHVVSSFSYYAANPFDVIKVWNGGLSIFGALIAGFIVILFWWQRESLTSLPKILDWLAPSVLLGQIIGRFGNLFNYEAFGYATTLPWKMFVPKQFRPLDSIQNAFYHPLFLYEAVGNAIVLFILFRMDRTNMTHGTHKTHGVGRLFFMYLLLYNVLRFFLELLRTDSTFIGDMRLNSVTSGLLAMAGFVGLIVLQNLKSQNPNAK